MNGKSFSTSLIWASKIHFLNMFNLCLSLTDCANIEMNQQTMFKKKIILIYSAYIFGQKEKFHKVIRVFYLKQFLSLSSSLTVFDSGFILLLLSTILLRFCNIIKKLNWDRWRFKEILIQRVRYQTASGMFVFLYKSTFSIFVLFCLFVCVCKCIYIPQFTQSQWARVISALLLINQRYNRLSCFNTVGWLVPIKQVETNTFSTQIQDVWLMKKSIMMHTIYINENEFLVVWYIWNGTNVFEIALNCDDKDYDERERETALQMKCIILFWIFRGRLKFCSYFSTKIRAQYISLLLATLNGVLPAAEDIIMGKMVWKWIQMKLIDFQGRDNIYLSES